jgi:hypothetical protein
MTFLGEQNSYDIHLKADFVEKILSLELKNNCEQIPWYQILFDKQLVNLVNDNIKKWVCGF